MTDSFHRLTAGKPGELHEILICGGSPHGEIGWRSLCFALCLFIYLFIYCLFVCLLFNYFKEAVCCFMHQLCGLAPWRLGVGGGAISLFWWVSSGLIYSPLALMEGKMR